MQPERLRFLSAGKPLEAQALRTIALVLLFASVVTPAFAQKKKSNPATEPKESATQQQAAAPVGAAAQQEDAESKDPWKALIRVGYADCSRRVRCRADRGSSKEVPFERSESVLLVGDRELNPVAARRWSLRS